MLDEAELKVQYKNWTTEALLELHASGSLSDDAYEVLEDILRERSVRLPDRPKGPLAEDSDWPDWMRRARANASKWAQIFALVGIFLPVILLVAVRFVDLDVKTVFPVIFPASFVLFLFDWRGDIGVEVVIAIAVNAIVFAGIGWLLGYGWPRSRS